MRAVIFARLDGERHAAQAADPPAQEHGERGGADDVQTAVASGIPHVPKW